ncbi:flagellar export chaperone FliS [Cellulomonas sp. URHD0024]|uniref:flagellar export chaperone FliS n=1 Tax=Cellulomonas sp. URHD0024 TaxID=1302620 RepID=UPI000415C0A6|nr:flagellar export chaperone FliS [Cellulomonas sp. URHD0024]
MHSVRSQYVASAVATVGPARLLTMLYERMLLDVDRAVGCLRAGDRVEGTQHLAHAQEIVAELMVSLQVEAWEGGAQLMSIYQYLLAELIESGVKGDADRAVACRDLIMPLAEAWQDAADGLARSASTPAGSMPTRDDAMTAGLLGVG